MTATLLNWSDEAFVALERYAPLVRRDPGALQPSLFEQARLHDFRHRECGYASFGSKLEYSDKLANPKDFGALGGYRFIGDKITHLFRRFALFDAPEWAGRDVTIVHVLRNLHSVVASYLARERNARDSWAWGADDALRDWTDAVEHAHAFHQDADRTARLLLVDYDWMHGDDEQRFLGAAEKLFDGVGLAFGEKARAGAVRLYRNYQSIPRNPPLDSGMRDYVERGIDPGTLVKYEALRRWSIR